MPASYNDYILEKHIQNIKRNPYYIKKVPTDELNYKLCTVAMEGAAGDYELFKWLLENHPNFVDENLCKIAVNGEPKKKFVRSCPTIEDPDGYTYYCDEYKYFDPVIKYVPENFRTADVCRASAKHDWRTLQFVPVAIQLSSLDICKTAVSNYHQIMNDDVNFQKEYREKVIFGALSKSVFEQYPDFLNGERTFENVSKDWMAMNPHKVGTVLLKNPKHINKLSKDFRKNHFDVIRDVAAKNPEILLYLSASEQEKLRDIISDTVKKHPEVLAYLTAQVQKGFADLVKSALKTGKIKLWDVKQDVQVLIPETCIEKLTNDPYETRWLCKEWAHEPIPGLNLRYLCEKLQNQNPELISKIVCEHIELMDDVNMSVLIAHPEICVAAVEQYGEAAYKKIPQGVFDKNPDLYEKLLQKRPELLTKFPAKIQTCDNWTRALSDAPWLAPWAPVQYTTVEHYRNAFLGGTMQKLSRVPDHFRTYEICKMAVTRAEYNLEYVPDKIKKQYPDVCGISIAGSPYEIDHVPVAIQLQNPWLCKMAVTGDPMSLKYVKRSVQQKYPEICRLAMAQLVADFGWMSAGIFPKKLKVQKDKLYASISPDVLKKYWDYINNTQGVITVKKSDRYR